MNRADLRRLAVTLTAGVTLAVAIASLLAPPRINVAAPAEIAVAAAALLQRRRLLWGVVAILVALTFVPLLLDPSVPRPVWTNRALTALALFVTAAIAHLWIDTRRALRRQQRELVARNDALAAREVEIATQNEELQLQGEELERQGEELRVTNEDLANRERILAQLLDLARTVGGATDRRDALARICDALVALLDRNATAAAVLVRAGDRLRVVCHVGFGDDPPDGHTIPVSQSFAGLVMTRRQPGYVADLIARPDLRVPQPRSGAPLRSVVAAPVWVDGMPAGALEAYARDAVHWSDDEVALISSMAAQASLSLQTARLFEEVDRSRRRFQAVFDTLPVAVLVSDDVGCAHVAGNPAAAALFHAATDANFSPFARSPATVRRECFRAGIRLDPTQYPIVRAARGEVVEAEEIDVVAGPGRGFTTLASATPIHDAQGVVRGAVCAIVDITAQKALERELETRRREAEEASVRKTRFLAAVSHDIRTPANAIRLQAELIRRSTADPALATRVPYLVRDLHSSAVTLVELVSEMLDLARLDTGRVELQEDRFSLGQTIAEECRQLTPVAEAKGVAMVCPVLDPPIWLHTDRVKLARVLGNLLENAVKFTAAGQVGVAVSRPDGGGVQIDVADTGSGIPPEHLPRIFDEFFQLRNPERDQSKGRGLGLAICRRLVEAMGGRITAASEPGRGATFTVILPPATVAGTPPAHATRASDASHAPRLAGRRVLLVEDHGDTREAMAHLLRSEGAMVTAMSNGREALAAIPDTDADVLLLDLMMPELDGTELLRRLAIVRPASLTRIVVVTGDHAAREEPLDGLGVDAVLAKPVDPDALVAALGS